MFLLGRARRERSIAGFGLSVRAFVRSVSHVKVRGCEIPSFFEKFACVSVQTLVKMMTVTSLEAHLQAQPTLRAGAYFVEAKMRAKI